MVAKQLREEYARWLRRGVTPAAVMLDVSSYRSLVNEVSDRFCQSHSLDRTLTWMGVPLYVVPVEGVVRQYVARSEGEAQAIIERGL